MIIIFKIGDIVARKSYKMDIMFRIIDIKNNIADLVGVTVRIFADSELEDLIHISDEEKNKRIKNFEFRNKARIDRSYNNLNNNYYYKNIRNINNMNNPNMYIKETVYKRPGVILHIDGDDEYTEKCKENYKKMGLKAFVYNIKEEEQYKYVYSLLQKIRPDILILTGHDSFFRKKNDMYNIENYKNSKYFIQAILEARRYEHNLDNLVIFAGACQSYYEALISAGANFASSPKRVLIDMLDPIIIAESIAYTPVNKYISIKNIIENTREGIDGIGGMETKGQYRQGIPRNVIIILHNT